MSDRLRLKCLRLADTRDLRATGPSGTTELFELIENHLGKAFVKVQQAMQVQVPMMQPPSPSNP